jgi:putative oxidoreductase
VIPVNGGMNAASVIGRLIFGGFFLYSGINHVKHRQAMVQYARAKNVPGPDLAIPLSTIALLVGGASIVLGVKPRLGALSVAAFLAAASPTIHDFWNADPQTKQNELIHFSKNIALLGAALIMMGTEE